MSVVLSNSIIQAILAQGDTPDTPEEWIIASMNYLHSSVSGGSTQIKVSLTAAQIKTLNSVPVQVIPAPGAGKMIELISCSAKLNFGTTQFTSTSIHLDVLGAGNGAFQLTTSTVFLDSGVSVTTRMFDNDSTAIDNSLLIENQPIIAMADVDSAVGDSTVDLYINYRIITI